MNPDRKVTLGCRCPDEFCRTRKLGHRETTRLTTSGGNRFPNVTLVMFLIPPKPSVSWENAKEQREPGCEESAPKMWGEEEGEMKAMFLKWFCKTHRHLK